MGVANTMWNNWIIRKIVKKGKYLYAVVPEHPRANEHGYVLAHRVVLENKIQRMLEPYEDVHHKNENKHDNRPSNLEIKTRGEHQRYHMKIRFPNGDLIKLVCANCGNEFSRSSKNSPKAKGYKRAFCSRNCSGKYNGFKSK